MDSSQSSTSRYSLFALAALFLVLAAGVWNMRARHARVLAASQEQTQHAIALLIRAFLADNQLKYSAISDTSAQYGRHQMRTEARITRAPHNLSIVYLKGDKEGLHSGFSDRWFWRQSNRAAPMQAYAAMQRDANEAAARHFALMLNNYHVRWLKSDTIDGRPVEVVDIRPYHPVPGAQGPGKRLGIDEATGLTLKVETFNYRMEPVMSSTLSQVDLTPQITAATFESPAEIMKASKSQSWIMQEMGDQEEAVARRIGIYPPRPRFLPAGFAYDGVGMHRCDGASAPNASLTRYSDGLNTLTVFAMKPEMPAMKNEGGKGDQACNFGPGTLMMRDTPTGRLIAVADLPSPTLRQIVDSTDIRLMAVKGQ